MTAQIPSVQTAALIKNPGSNARIEIRHDYPVPQPGKNEVLLKMECSGICYSDIYVYTGNNPHYDEVPCHEGIGQVVQLGPDVADTLLGQRVGLGWIYSVCGHCYNCKYVVANADYLMPIPDELSSFHAAPFLCGGITMVGALSLSDDALADGDTLVISGSGGGLGHLGLQLASNMKSHKRLNIIAIDTGSTKQKLSLELGANAFIDFKTEDVIKRVMELTNGKGADVAIVVPAATEAFDQALKYLKFTGTMVCAGITRMDYRLPISPTDLEYRGLVIKACHVGSEKQLKDLLISAGKKEVVPKVEVFEFSKTGELFERVKRGDIVGRFVVQIPQ
ncbi:zinc-binding dehydrogenase domain-containing protein [Trichoderma breve]|uniref:Zinc-binding dehydrogenase domain-containing protein n=1 Tax=Trichoderma breve TaxID=2034170 RepID=A0A9W9E988_9HYPO|nr:zinc-binding dehydrogenase domain-containing protein [Trichoderma breve]KAJ4862565.1 zinc-binding dehydrogenase domain-containing protein [Trichoderma breve]